MVYKQPDTFSEKKIPMGSIDRFKSFQFNILFLFTFYFSLKGFFNQQMQVYAILICHAIVITLKVAVFCPCLAETKHLLSIVA